MRKLPPHSDRRLIPLFLAILLGLTTLSGHAQGRWCAIEGIVMDESGGLLQGAAVTARSVDQGHSRSVLSDGSGYFRITHLEPGGYRISVRMEGFSPWSSDPVRLELNQLSRMEVRLSVDGVASELEVAGILKPLDVSLSGLSSLVGRERIQDLPLNGRDYVQLALLHAGVHEARAQSRGVNTGPGVQLSISGSRPVQNTYLLDGIGLADHSGSTPGSVNGLNFGVDAIREFSILTSSFSALQGRSAGGVVQAVTRSGSNEFRGGAVYFHRNDNLDARNFFDPEEAPEFRRHHFGVFLGGPLVRERTFFFVNTEALRQVRGRSQIDTTLSENARLGQLESGMVEVDSAVANVLRLYPSPNGAVFGDTGLFLFPNDLRSRDWFLTSRIDHRLSGASQLFVRYTLTDGAARDQTTFALDESRNAVRHQSLALEETHTFSPTLLHSVRAGFSRTHTVNNVTEALDQAIDSPDLVFFPGAPSIGIIDVPGISAFPGGSRAQDADRAAFNSFQYYQDLAWHRGAHSLHVGFALERTHLNIDSQSLQSGEFRFASIADFLSNQPSRFSAQLPGSDTIRGFRQWSLAWYVQDSWRLSRRLSVDLGLRYEMSTVPTEVNGKLANLDEIWSPELRLGEPLYENPSLLNFGPRIGLAWDPFGNGRTHLRTGYGIFHDQVGLHYLLLAGLRNPPWFLRASIGSLSPGAFPSQGFEELLASPVLDLRAERIPRDLNQPYVQQWNLTLEQALGGAGSMRLAYAGSHGVHLSNIVEDANLRPFERLSDGRIFYPAGEARINAHFGQVRSRNFHGHSFYHALQSEWRWRASAAADVLVAYTFSRSIDDSSTTFAQTESGNAIGIPVNHDPHFNRGLSNHHQTHRFSSSLIWRLPSPAQTWARSVFGGWRMSLMGGYASGVPFTPTLRYDAARTGTSRPDHRGGQRPDLAQGFSPNPVTGDPARWFLPEAFARPEPGFQGNLGRNTLIGPDYRNVDIAFSKRYDLHAWSENASLDFRFEFFNVLNATNFDLPDRRRQEVFTSAGVPEDVGLITSASPSRQIQLGLRLAF